MTEVDGIAATRQVGDPAAAVLLVGFGTATSDDLSSRLTPGVAVLTAQRPQPALRILADREIAVICLGEGISGRRAQRFLSQALAASPHARTCNVVLAAGGERDLFQEFIDSDRLYYLTRRPPPASEIRSILRSAVERYRSATRQGARPGTEAAGTDSTLRVLELAQRLASEPAVDRVPAITAQAIEELLDADRACCLVYDPASETLWTRQPGDSEERRESAAAGLVSYVARTGTAVRLDRVGDDPRYDPEADNHRGSPEERFLAAPVVASAAGANHGVPGGVLAVVVALRAASRPPFSRRERDRLLFLAQQITPVFSRWTQQARLTELTRLRHAAPNQQTDEIFRREALEHRAQGFGDHGQVLQISPSWTRWAYRLLLAVFATAVLYLLTGSIDEYAAGPAVVRFEGRTEVTATVPGTVRLVAVEAGQRVAAGQLLARFDGAQEVAERDRIQRELELGLIQRLRNPADTSAARTLSGLRAQAQLAAARLEARSVRAPGPGLVSDLRIRPGQHLDAGQVVLSLLSGSDERSIVAMFPGHYRPLIEPGMPLRLELDGYRYAYQHLVVDRVGDEVVGPAEARRFLGAGVGDAVALSGPLVLAYARLPAATFESDGRSFEYRDGIQGTVELRVRATGLLPALVPALKALLPSSHG